MVWLQPLVAHLFCGLSPSAMQGLARAKVKEMGVTIERKELGLFPLGEPREGGFVSPRAG